MKFLQEDERATLKELWHGFESSEVAGQWPYSQIEQTRTLDRPEGITCMLTTTLPVYKNYPIIPHK